MTARAVHFRLLRTAHLERLEPTQPFATLRLTACEQIASGTCRAATDQIAAVRTCNHSKATPLSNGLKR